ncbi:hypothetical protein GCM10009665_48410 [Kitasatospora nipponensis]|uniref:Secreted protein n=1 Tax=Kitasatospora nipponensis TaxID=258049 RepID=A0ABP4H6H9_9ACTN
MSCWKAARSAAFIVLHCPVTVLVATTVKTRESRTMTPRDHQVDLRVANLLLSLRNRSRKPGRWPRWPQGTRGSAWTGAVAGGWMAAVRTTAPRGRRWVGK